MRCSAVGAPTGHNPAGVVAALAAGLGPARWPAELQIIRALSVLHTTLLRPLLRFGMLFQVLTVRRPSDDQVEVSLAAFNRVRFLTEGIPEPEQQQLREAEAAGAFVS